MPRIGWAAGRLADWAETCAVLGLDVAMYGLLDLLDVVSNETKSDRGCCDAFVRRQRVSGCTAS